ncbi:MAG: hypothetical protein PHH87_01235 [Desulfuromonas sp.]|nr:hypothetical protein [Desulfuromonas sp.]
MLSTNPGAQAYVWCVKQEGSSTLATAAHNPHNLPASASKSTSSITHCCTGSACELNCASCIDIPFETEFSTSSTYQLKKMPAQDPTPQWHELQWLHASTATLARTQLPESPPRISSTIRVQRTTVLLI